MQAEPKSEQIVCLRCSETYLRASVQLRTVLQLTKIAEAERVRKLMDLEGISRSAAEAWLKHNRHMSCAIPEAHCPNCGGQLTTWQAKWCQHCKFNWH